MANAPIFEDDAPVPKDESPIPTTPNPIKETRKSNSRGTALKASLQKSYETAGAMVGFLGDQHCGQVLIDNAPEMASAMDQWARENPQVKKVLERMLEATAVSAVLAAHAPIAISIYAHHVAPKIAERRMRAEQEEWADDVDASFNPDAPPLMDDATGTPIYTPPQTGVHGV